MDSGLLNPTLHTGHQVRILILLQMTRSGEFEFVRMFITPLYDRLYKVDIIQLLIYIEVEMECYMY